MAGFWRNCRITFRWLRIATWLAALAALGAGLWFNRVGLPGFLKTRLVTRLQAQGVDLEFSRMRLYVIRGFVAENVRIGGAKSAGHPVLAADEVQLQVALRSLLQGRLEVDGLVVRDGRFSLPLSPTNALVLTNLQAGLRFRENETWSLDHFQAWFSGARISLSGEVAHAPEIRRWKMFQGLPAGDQSAALRAFQRFSSGLNTLEFGGQPQLSGTLNGDARDAHSFTLRLNAGAASVRTPWFSARNLQAHVTLTAPADAPVTNDAAWGFWTNLQPFRIAGSLKLADLRTETISAGSVAGEGVWRAPVLAVSRFSAQLGGGQLNASASLDVATRELVFTNDSDFDLHAVAVWLTDQARTRLDQIAWSEPPVLHAEGAFTLPPWNRGASDWRDGIEPSVRLHGELAFTNATVNGLVSLDRVRSHFSYASLIWKLPDLELVQGRTRLELDGEESEATKNFQARVRGDVDAASVRPLLTTTNAHRALEVLNFGRPLAGDLEVSGNLRQFDRLAATGRITLQDFAVRGQTVDRVDATLSYTNLVADFSQLQLVRAGGAQTFSADKVTLDLAGQKLFVTGGRGRLDPQVVSRAIGPKAARVMEPYQFLSLPEARVSGCVPLRQADGELVLDDADLRADILGTIRFRWRKFETPAINGTVIWLGRELILTNLTSEVYGGAAQGWGDFDLKTPGDGTDLSFFISATNVDLHRMGVALWSPTNQTEGELSGSVTVSDANSDDWRTWNGSGEARLHDGLLWNIPIFGLLSPVLNTAVPGLGNSRATDATARFNMTNGVIRTDSLEVRTALMRLQYIGTVDLQQEVNARVTAQPMRDVWGLGPLVSTMLWPVGKVFECQVTGQLGEPTVTPIYSFSKLLLAPLRPVHTFEELFKPPATTNPPPAK